MLSLNKGPYLALLIESLFYFMLFWEAAKQSLLRDSTKLAKREGAKRVALKFLNLYILSALLGTYKEPTVCVCKHYRRSVCKGQAPDTMQTCTLNRLTDETRWQGTPAFHRTRWLCVKVTESRGHQLKSTLQEMYDPFCVLLRNKLQGKGILEDNRGWR